MAFAFPALVSIHFGGDLAVGGDMTHDALAMVEYRTGPAVFIIGDSEAAVTRARATAALSDIPVSGTARLDEGWSGALPSGPTLVELDRDGPYLDTFLPRLTAEAEIHNRSAAIAVSEALIDRLFASAWHPNILLACNPSDDQRGEDLAAILTPRDARLHDIGRQGQDVLNKLSQDVGRIAATLASLAEEERTAALVQAEREDEVDVPDLDPAAIRALIRARRLRDHYFHGALFADPAWDMLLDLMAARLEGMKVAVSSLCIAAAVPATTALRWIKELTERGLFVRVADPADGRRVFITLSEETARSLAAYLRAVQRIGAPVI